MKLKPRPSRPATRGTRRGDAGSPATGHGRAVALAVASGYAVFGFLWILLSDRLLTRFVDDAETLTRLHSYKGWLFVTLTTIVVYLLVRVQTHALERVVRESETRLRQIIDLVPHMIFAKDQHGAFLLANEAVADAYGIDVDALVGAHQQDLHPDRAEAARMQEDDDRVIEAGTPLSRPEQPFTDTHHNRRFLETHRIPFRVSGSDEPAVLCVSVDVTGRRSVEQRLREREELLGLIIENAPTPIASVDANARLISANRAWCSMLGYSEEELKNIDFREYTAPDDVAASVGLIHKAMQGKLDTYTIRKRYIRKDGELVDVVLHNGVVHDEEGKPMILVAQAEDLTDRLRAEEEARVQQERLAQVDRVNIMGEMAAGIAHEVNQPLAAIVNRTSAARRRLDRGDVDLERLRETLERVNEQAFRAGEVVRRLRNRVRSQGGTREIVDVNELLREALGLAEVDARIHDVFLETDLAENLPPVLADRVQVTQVVLNLVRNAIDAMEEGHVSDRVIVVTSALTPEGSVEVAIADRGPGVSAESAEHIFDPFYTTKESGMGLGLAISASIIRTHEGKIWVEANHDERTAAVGMPGSVFKFSLPSALGEQHERERERA